jgi:anti-sigma B factor antagonist
MALRATYREAAGVTVVDIGGRITLGEGSALLRKTGIGELVSAYTGVKNRGGNLKLLHLTKKVHDLLQLTKLFTVFEVYSDESSALRSYK